MSSTPSKGVKRKRACYSLAMKMEIIKCKRNGDRVIDICRKFNIPDSTVHTILRNSNELEHAAKSSMHHSEIKITRFRNNTMKIMEKRLAVWIEELYQQNTTISLSSIQAKALTLHEDIRKELKDEKSKPFLASRGWFHRFQQRFGFRNVKIIGEAANEATDAFVSELEKITEDGGYDRKQIFNVDEIGLFWKRMPAKNYLLEKETRASGYEESKEQIAVLIGGNAEGDMKLKPLIVHHSPSENLGVSNDKFSVIWRSDKNGWITKDIFRYWFVNHFLVEVKNYCNQENLEFKLLLILDNASTHGIDFANLCPNVKIVFLPPRISVLQPLDQGVVTIFKTNYLRYVFRKIFAETDVSSENNVLTFLKNFRTYDSLEMISNSWNDISTALMRSCWRKLYPNEPVKDPDYDLNEIYEELAELANDVGFNEIQKEDIMELVAPYSSLLSNDDWEEVERNPEEEKKYDNEIPIIVKKEKQLCKKDLRIAIKKANEIVEFVSRNDPDENRSSKFSQGMKELMTCYEDLLAEETGE